MRKLTKIILALTLSAVACILIGQAAKEPSPLAKVIAKQITVFSERGLSR